MSVPSNAVRIRQCDAVDVAKYNVVGRELAFGTLERLAARAGGSPFFAIERDEIDRRISNLRTSVPQEISLRYSLKSNPFEPLVGHMASRVDGFDVTSTKELRIALDAGMAPEQVSFSGPGKSERAIAAAVGSGAVTTVESCAQLERVQCEARRLNCVGRVLLRLNPPVRMRRSGMSMGGEQSQFGMDGDELTRALAVHDPAAALLTGLHVYLGSQNLDGDRVAEAMSETWRFITTSSTLRKIACANEVVIGSGFGVPYHDDQKPLDLQPISRALSEVVENNASSGVGARIGLELGRYLVSSAGSYVARVRELKRCGSKTYAVIDGGLHHHQAACGLFGQVLFKPYRSYAVPRAERSSEPMRRYDIVGCLCTPLDRFALDKNLPPLTVGDFFVVQESGAYAATASPVNFLGHPPAEQLLF